MQPYEPFNPQTLTPQQLPKNERTRDALFRGEILVYPDSQNILCAERTATFEDFDPHGIPLAYAVLTSLDGKYDSLFDSRALPSDEDRQNSPAMYSRYAFQSREKLNLLSCIKQLLLILPYQNDTYNRPAYSERLQKAILAAQQTIDIVNTYSHFIHDKRMLPLLTELVNAFRDDVLRPAHIIKDDEYVFPEETIEQIGIRTQQLFFFHTRPHYFEAKTLFYWYTVKTLYILRTVSTDESVGTRYTIVSSEKDRAMMEIAHTHSWNHSTDYDIDRWELLANEDVIYSIKRDGRSDHLIALANQYDALSDRDWSYFLR